MTEYHVIPATVAHAEELAATMRLSDVEELAAVGYAPLPAILVSMRDDCLETFAGLADGKVICIFGLNAKSVFSEEGFPWLLTSTEMPKHARVFLKMNRRYINSLKRRYKLLWGRVSERNTVSIRWLGWLGFEIDAKLGYPTPGGPGFHYFHMENV